MPLAYAKLLISKNGGATQTGGVTAAAGNTIQLSGENPSYWTHGQYEIYDWPPGWTAPGGWTLQTTSEGSKYVFYSVGGAVPPLITIGTEWGKWLCRLVVNDGMRNGVVDATLTDDKLTAFMALAPSGLHGIGTGEGGQFAKSWAAEIDANFRLINIAILSGITVTGSFAVSGYDTVDHSGGGQEVRNLTGYLGVVNVRGSASLAFGSSYPDHGTIRSGNDFRITGLDSATNARTWLAYTGDVPKFGDLSGQGVGAIIGGISLSFYDTTTGSLLPGGSGASLIAQITKDYFFLHAPILVFAEDVTDPVVGIAPRTSNAACKNLFLLGQEPFATATGANRNSGGYIYGTRAPASGGTAGNVVARVGGADVWTLTPTAATLAILAGTGSRMVVADGSGTLSTQSIPGGATGENQLLYSEQFDNAAWTKIGTTIGANAGSTPPSGPTSAADQLKATATSTTYCAVEQYALAGGGRTASVYVKAGTKTWVGISLFKSGSFEPEVDAWFHLSGGGSVGTVQFSDQVPGSGAAADLLSITSLGSGWYRIALKAPAYSAYYDSVAIFAADGDFTFTTANTANDVLLEINGAQAERLPRPTAESYTLTTSAAVLDYEIYPVAVPEYDSFGTKNDLRTGATRGKETHATTAGQTLSDMADAGGAVRAGVAGAYRVIAEYIGEAAANAWCGVYEELISWDGSSAPTVRGTKTSGEIGTSVSPAFAYTVTNGVLFVKLTGTPASASSTTWSALWQVQKRT